MSKSEGQTRFLLLDDRLRPFPHPELRPVPASLPPLPPPPRISTPAVVALNGSPINNGKRKSTAVNKLSTKMTGDMVGPMKRYREFQIQPQSSRANKLPVEVVKSTRRVNKYEWESSSKVDEPEGQRESTAIKGKVKRGMVILHKLPVEVVEVNKSQQANPIAPLSIKTISRPSFQVPHAFSLVHVHPYCSLRT